MVSVEKTKDKNINPSAKFYITEQYRREHTKAVLSINKN